MPRFVRDPAISYRLLPPDTSLPLWRYQDLAKFVWILTNKCLWFSRTDRLGDPYEGSSTRVIRDSLIAALGAHAESILAQWSTANRAFVTNAAVNCWHMGEHESAAMWSLYVRSGQGVAIRSTIDRFVHSFPEGTAVGAGRDTSGAAKVLAVEFGAVRYIDHHHDSVPRLRDGYNVTDAFFLKRKSFEHEREFRAVLFDLPIQNEAVSFERSVFPERGVAVPVNIETLIEAVYVPPGAESWFKQVVESVCERFTFTVPVLQSRMDEDPLF